MISCPGRPDLQWRRCTGLQRAMLLSSLKGDVPGAYVQQLVVRLNEELNPRMFLHAAEACLGRHGGLMARFEFRQGELFQARTSGKASAGEEIDLRGECGPVDERLDRFLAHDRALSLPLLRDRPLWRSAFVSFGGREAAWVWTHHHVLCDGTSYRPLLVELFTIYGQLCSGGPLPSQCASPDFFDYLAWREAQDWSAQKLAWNPRFQPGDAPTSLPEVRGSIFDLEKDAPSNRGIKLSDETRRSLRSLCEDNELTLNTVVIAAWGLWLARMQSEKKAIFGIMREARKSTIAGAEGIIGPLVNTVPIAVQVVDETPLLEWLSQVRTELLALRELEHCSLADVAQWTGLRVGAMGPWSLINFQRARLSDQLRAGGLPPHRCNITLVERNDVPLLVNTYELPYLAIDIISQPRRVSEATARAAARGLKTVLCAIATDPHRAVGEIDLLTDEDDSILKKACRGPRVEVPEKAAHELIEQQIRQQPRALAMKQGRREVSFGELGEIATQVGKMISAAGRSGEVIAVILPPGPDILCAILGILRAGAPFFLINPASPRTEREAMLRRLSVSLAITDEALAIQTRASVPHVIEFEDAARAPVSRSQPMMPAVRGDDLAYLVHTSGSAGEKKFVEVEHRSLANTIRALVGEYGMQAGDRRISRATPGNDYFIIEVLICLSAGGTLIFPERCGTMSLSEFVETLRRERVTVTGLPASYWHEWVSAMDERDADQIPPDLRLVISSMEKANPQLLMKWNRIAGERVAWLNAYGPAETTIVATIYRAGDEAAPDSANVPIGRPIANTAAYVLDARRRKLPVGIIGEIAIAGIGVARGYHDDAEGTAEKFIPNPHATSNEFARLYLTGDYGYFDDCGQLVFVGRRDQQVKISGHRIELGEVEVALQEYAQVRQVVVTAEGDGGKRRLVAHILPNGAFDPVAMRTWMQTHLSPHLRPADLVTVERIPIMPTGKVDRRALSESYRARVPPAANNSIAHVTGTEGKMLALWMELFGGRQVIAPSDSFFHLGGDSLLAVRLLAQIEHELGATLSLHDLLRHPTIAELASIIDRARSAGEFTSLIQLNSGGSGKPLFILHGWSGGVLHCLEFARRLEGSRPVLGLQAVEHAGYQRHRSFEEMASHYADEIVRAHAGVTYELFGHSLGGMIAYATACELVRRGEQVGRLYVVDTIPLNLPRTVHVRRVVAELRPRVVPHLHTLFSTGPRYWPRYLRARRGSLESRLRKWPSRDNPERKPIAPDADYYDAVGRDYYPPQSDFEVKLFTPLDRFPTSIYWRYLTSGPVTNYAVKSGHIDMFEPRNLDDFMAAFEQASAGGDNSRSRSGTFLPRSAQS